MKKYLAVWWDYYRMNYREIQAENPTEAKKKAFRMMCDCAGDKLYSVDVYELKATIESVGEYNPHPHSWAAQFASRDYTTGRKLKKGGRR